MPLQTINMKHNINDKLQKINKEHYTLLVEIGKIAKLQNLKAYLVGGMVRDLLLGFDNLDIDIVVENNAKLLAEALVKHFPNCELSVKHDRFHTAKIIFNTNNKKIPIDLASTRQEIYEHPAALPQVTVSDLKKDLYRRDFTINALAVSLMPDEFGEVVDLFDGLTDLKNKKIRVLHNLSFIDDPTRMIRAVRFSAKLGFEIEENTKKLLKEVVDSRQFDNLIHKIRGDRVKIEIRYLFNLPNIEDVINVFFESGIYKMVSTSLTPSRGLPRQTPINNLYDRSLQWLIYLAIIIKDLDQQSQDQIMKNLQMTGDETKIIKSAFRAHEKLQEKNIDSIFVYRTLKDLPSESITIVKTLFGVKTPRRGVFTISIDDLINEYLEKTSKIKLEITGQDLISMGIPSGKKIGDILDKILEIKIQNPKMKKEDEIKEAKSLIKPVQK